MDTGVDQSGVPVVAVLPDVFEELLTAEDLLGRGREMEQQLQLGGGEGDPLARLGDGETGPVDGQLPVELDGGPAAGRLLDAPQHGPYPGLDDLGTGGLDDVVVGAGLQADDDVEVVTAGGQHDDRQLAALADPAADLHAVDAGQHEVEQQQIRPELRERVETGLPRGSGAHLVPAAPEPELDAFADGGVVFYQEHAGHL